MFDKVDWFISECNGTKQLALFRPEKCDAFFNRIKYLKSLKSKTSYFFSQNYAKMKIDLVDDLPPEKALTLHNVVMFIKSVFNENPNHRTATNSQKNVQMNYLKNNDNKS